MNNQVLNISNEEEPKPQEFPTKIIIHKDPDSLPNNTNDLLPSPDNNNNSSSTPNPTSLQDNNNPSNHPITDININDNDTAILQNPPITSTTTAKPLNPINDPSNHLHPSSIEELSSTPSPTKPQSPPININTLYTSIYNLSTKPSPSDFTNINQNDLQSLSYSYLKHLSKIRINKNESFMVRMLFDIMKRQSQEKNLSSFLNQTKAKMKEEERIKGFNRLIEDANRRLEAQEKLDELKMKIEQQDINIDNKPIKKYKCQQWKDVYDKRFKKYQLDKEERIKKKISEMKEKEKLKEEEEIKMCKAKKAPRKVTEMYGQRMYDESVKRRDTKSKGNNKRIKDKDKDKGNDKVKKSYTPQKVKVRKIDIENNNNKVNSNECKGNNDEKNGDNETINDVVVNSNNNNNNHKNENSSVNSFIIPKLNPADFIYNDNNNIISSNNNGSLYTNNTILSEFFTKQTSPPPH